MTINIGVITSDAVILGCDSIASSTMWVVDPLAVALRDQAGNIVVNPDGTWQAQIQPTAAVRVVNNVWGGATKLFQVHAANCPAAAVTSGIAKLQNKNVDTVAREFFRINGKSTATRMEGVVGTLLAYLRAAYDATYAGRQPAIPNEFRDELQLLVGGQGLDDPSPSIWRLDVKENAMDRAAEADRAAICWGGQADAVERLFYGYDTRTRDSIEEQVKLRLEEERTAIQESVVQYLNAHYPGGVNPPPPQLQLPPPNAEPLKWGAAFFFVDCQNIPRQSAVDLVGNLVMLQSLRARFGGEVPTVGGRVHVGVVSLAEGFQALNEPEITHKHTGFGDVF